MLFLKLPVRDLATARAFYEALGFRINEHSSDEHTAAVVVDDDFVVTLLTRDRFAELVPGEPGDPARPTAVPCLSVLHGTPVVGEAPVGLRVRRHRCRVTLGTC